LKKGKELEKLSYARTIRGGSGMGKVRRPQKTPEKTADVVCDTKKWVNSEYNLTVSQPARFQQIKFML
jgi:hypothetical protein